MELRSVGGDFVNEAAIASGVRAMDLPRPAKSRLMVIPGNLALLSKTVTISSTERGEERVAIKAEVARSIPFSLDEVIWEIVPVGKSTQAARTFLLVATRREPVEALCSALVEAGITPVSVGVVPILEASVFQEIDGDETEASLFLHMGETGTHYGYLDKDQLAIRSANPGLRRATGEDLARHLERELTRWLATDRRRQPRRVPRCLRLTGIVEEGLAEALEEQLGYPVERFVLPESFTDGSPVPPDEVRRRAAFLPTLFGAAIYSTLPRCRRIDLLPEAYRRHLVARRRSSWLLAGTLVVLLLGAAGWGICRQALQSASIRLNEMRVELAPIRALQRSIKAEEARIAGHRAEAVLVRSLVASRSNWSGFLADLQNRLTAVENVWIDTLEPHAKGGLRISGCMLDQRNPLKRVSLDMRRNVEELIRRIEDSQYVGGIAQERFDTSEPGILRFSFVMTADPSHLR